MSKIKEQYADSFDKYGAMINFDDLDGLVGKLLTYVDATYTDLEQRNAHKSIIKTLCRDWYYDCENNYPVKRRFKKNGNPNEVEYVYWDKKSYYSQELTE